jgi:hypothetical protein
MSILAHSLRAARGMHSSRRNLDREIAEETKEAKRIQQQLGCTWSEALRIAARIKSEEQK